MHWICCIVCFLIVGPMTVLSSDDCVNVTAPKPEEINFAYTYKAPSSLAPFYSLANSFINTAQPNSVPYDKLQTLVDKGISWDTIKPLIFYEAGLAALLIIGIIFMVCMPFVGCVFACCRCCNNCGGKRYQPDPSAGYFWAYVFLLVTVFAFLTAGCVLYGVNNTAAWDEVPHVRDNVAKEVDVLILFAQQFLYGVTLFVSSSFSGFVGFAQSVVAGLTVAMNRTLEDTAGIQQFQTIGPSFKNIESDLGNLTNTVTTINGESTSLAGHINAVFLEFNNFNWAQAPNLSVIDSQQDIEVFFDIDALVNLTIEHDVLATLSDALQFESELAPVLAQINTALASTTQQVSSTMKSISNANETLQTNLNSILSGFTTLINNALQLKCNALNTLSDDKINNYYWVHYVGLVLIIPIVLVLVCLLCGLLLGFIGFRGTATAPTARSAVSNHGGNCLMAAVGFAFIFSFILMFFTMLLFTLGYLTQTVICKPIFQDQTYQMFNFVQNNWLTNLGGSTFNINLTHTITACQQNRTLYDALDVKQIFNLDDIRKNINDVLGMLQDYKFVEKFSVDKDVFRANTSELTAAQKALGMVQTTVSHYQATTLTHKAQVAQNNVNSALRYLKNIRTPTNDQLSMQTNMQYLSGNLSNLLNDYVNLANIQSTTLLLDISQTQQDLQKALDVSLNPNAAFDAFTLYVNSTIVNTSAYVQKFANDVLTEIQSGVGFCRPLYDVYTGIGDVLCKEVLDPLQAIWLALGWCLLFYIPTVIFSVKLAKYFRRMDTNTGDENLVPMTSFFQKVAGKVRPGTNNKVDTTHAWR